MKVTIEDVAKKAGVSKTTVSRIINGNYTHTKEETRRKVLQVIEELNYQPNALAKGLKQVRTNVIGLVVSNLQNSFWTEVLQGVEDTCRHYGYQLMICNTNEDEELEMESIRALQLRQVDGIVINPTVKNESYFAKLLENHYPIVSINRKFPNLKVDSVVMDNIKGASLAVEHLIRHGKTDIAIFVYDNERVSPWKERLEGYKRTMIANGFTEKDFNIQLVKQKDGEVKKALIRFLQQSSIPDAIFSTNNMMTLEILDGIRECGLSVPDDIALVSYDDTVWSKHLDPPLTTVCQPRYEMGKNAAQKLIKMIKTKSKEKPNSVLLEPTLIVRRSCGTKNPAGRERS